MASVVSQAEQRVVLYDVSWATYEHLLADHLDSSSPRFTYDGGTLEIMSPSMEHEEANRGIAAMVEAIADQWRIDLMNLGSTTFKRVDFKKGFEPDTCFYFENAKRIRGKRKVDLYSDPPPDLVIEIDITSDSIDKLPIYAALGIPEVWRYIGNRLVMLTLAGNNYAEAEQSIALPGLTGQVIVRFIEALSTMERAEWVERIREWARSHRPK
ncbi:MAG: Uma2 family endonuclease [Blastocatellia bacterium]